MKKYKLITISEGTYIQMQSTDSQTISWLISEIRKLIPSCQEKYTWKLPSSNDLCLCSLEKLQNQDAVVPWLMMKKLCEHGWEPFAYHEETGHGKSYSFRFEEPQ